MEGWASRGKRPSPEKTLGATHTNTHTGVDEVAKRPANRPSSDVLLGETRNCSTPFLDREPSFPLLALALQPPMQLRPHKGCSVTASVMPLGRASAPPRVGTLVPSTTTLLVRPPALRFPTPIRPVARAQVTRLLCFRQAGCVPRSLPCRSSLPGYPHQTLSPSASWPWTSSARRFFPPEPLQNHFGGVEQLSKLQRKSIP
jgi:hypothetical protein